jgi:hypothetical protein
MGICLTTNIEPLTHRQTSLLVTQRINVRLNMMKVKGWQASQQALDPRQFLGFSYLFE